MTEKELEFCGLLKEVAEDILSLRDNVIMGNVAIASETSYDTIVECLDSLEQLLGYTMEPPVEDKKETLEDFLNRVVDSLEFEHEVIKGMWKTSLAMAIEKLEHRRGYAECLVPLASGHVQGELNVGNSLVSLVVGDKEFLFEKNDDVAAEEEVEECDCQCETECEECCMEVEEEDCDPCMLCDCDAYCQEDMTLLDYVKTVDEKAYSEVEVCLHLIEKHFETKKEFDQEDYELIRYFLLHKSNASPFEIECLSDRGLELALNRHLYLAGKLK